MDKKLKALDKNLEGKIGISVEWLETGERWGVRNSELFPTASLIKIFILAVLYNNAKTEKINLKRRKLELRKKDIVKGSGVLRDMTPGLKLPLRDLAYLMIIVSDNTATNLIIDYLGLKNINKQLYEWGFSQTQLHRKIYFTRKQDDAFWLAVSSPDETTDLLSKIARRKLLGRKFDGFMEEVLNAQHYSTALPRLLPGSGT